MSYQKLIEKREETLTVKEVADYLKMGEKRVRESLAQSMFPRAYRTGYSKHCHWVIPIGDADALRERMREYHNGEPLPIPPPKPSSGSHIEKEQGRAPVRHVPKPRSPKSKRKRG